MATINVVSEYEWKSTFHAELSAPFFMEHFDRLKNTFLDKVRPQDLVDYARPQSNPLHTLFEWNNEVAGEQYRIVQARQAMASVVIKVKSNDVSQREPVIIRAIINVREGKEQGYISIVNPLNEDEVERQLLHNSLREAYHFVRTYELLPQAKTQVDSMRAYLETYEEEAKDAGVKLAIDVIVPVVTRLGKGKLKVYTQVKPRNQITVAASNLQEPKAGFEASA